MRGIASRTTHDMAAWVYILKCADYVGCTTNLDQRLNQHGDGTFGGYTSTRRPMELVWTNEFQGIHDAIAFERRIKRWSRAKKQALISGDYDLLPELSARGFRPAMRR
jgi:putative endonuclease